MIVRERREVEELARLLDGAAPSDAASPRVRQLAQTADTVGDTVTLEAPDATFRAALRTQLLADIDALGAPPPEPTWIERAADAMAHGTARARRSTKLTVAGGVAGSLLATTGVTVAAASALPGETLYPVKRATESVRLSLAGDLAATGRLQLALASERLDELSRSLDHLSGDLAVEILDDMDAASVAGADALLTSARTLDRPELRAEVAAFTERQREGLAALIDELPVTARADAQDSLQLLRRIDAQLLLDTQPACDCAGVPAGATTGSGDDAQTCDCAVDDRSAAASDGSSPDSDADDVDTDDSTRDDRRWRLVDPPGADVDAGDRHEPGRTPGPVDDPLDEAVDSGRDPLDAVRDPLDDATDGLEDGLGDITDDLTDGLDDATDDLTDGLSDGLEDGLGDVTDDLDDATDDLGDVTDDLDDATDDLGDGLGDITDDLGDGLGDDTDDVTDDATDDVSEGVGGLLGGG